LAANINEVTKAKYARILMITGHIKALTNTVAALTKSFGNKENASPNMGNANQGSHPRQFNWPRNIGAYCWLHVHHPVSAKHASNTCTKKVEGHINNATDQKGGVNFWPATHRVKKSQQDHPNFKGKTAPTN
jgi:hypothetical protein